MRSFTDCVAVNHPEYQDALDPSLIFWDEPAGDLGPWPKTAVITSATIGASIITVLRSPMDNWPPVQEPGWSKPSLGNWWIVARLDDGVWHAATMEWLGVDRTTMSKPRFDGTDDLHGPMGAWVPVSGEPVYLLQSTHARSGVIRNNRQRTNIVAATMP